MGKYRKSHLWVLQIVKRVREPDLSEGIEEPVKGDLDPEEDEEAAEEVGGDVLDHADGHQKQHQLRYCIWPRHKFQISARSQTSYEIFIMPQCTGISQMQT